MEIPVITRVSDFESSLNSISSNPTSLISRLFSILQLGRLSTARLLLSKWTPILLALIYTLSSLARRIRIFIVQHRNRRRVIKDSLQKPLFTSDYESDDDVSTDTDDDELDNDNDDEDQHHHHNHGSCSNSPSDDESNSNPFLARFDEDFRVAGLSNSNNRQAQKRKFKIRRKRSWTGENLFSLSELVNGNSVVKFWDGLGLGLNIHQHDYDSSSSTSSKGSFPIIDLEREVPIGSILGEVPAVSISSPTVVFTASSSDGKLGLCSWDVRLRKRKPAMEVEWKWPCDAGKVGTVNAGGVDKVYVRSGSECYSETVVGGDMRKAETPLGNVTELDDGKWYERR